MATTLTVDSKKILSVVTDQAYGEVSVVVGADTAKSAFVRNVPQITGATATLLTDDKGYPKTTLTYQLS